MDRKTDIELVFSDAKGAMQARAVATAMIAVYYLNDFRYLPFETTKFQDLGGYVICERRREQYEKLYELRSMWYAYREKYAALRNGTLVSRYAEGAEERIGHIRREDCRFVMSDSDIGQRRQIDGYYFEDFFAMLCMIMAAVSPEKHFEGMCSTIENSHVKRILTRVVYDGKALTYEQMAGSPVYDAEVLKWTLKDDVFEKHSYGFPTFTVKILSEDQDALKQDAELAEWIRQVNDVQKEMVSAELRLMCDNYTDVRIFAASRDVGVRYRDAVTALLADKGYATKATSFYSWNECAGPHIVIPDSVTAIGNKTFGGRFNLESVEIPDSVTSIGSHAFEHCDALKEMRIPDSVTGIGDFAFAGCGGLRSITLPGKLKTISCGMLCGCFKLEGIIIPKSVWLIESYAFSGCDSLKSVVIPEGVERIEHEAFKGCAGLKSIVIPESAKKIGEAVFKDCSPDLVVCGKKGSAAERCAAENGLVFEEV